MHSVSQRPSPRHRRAAGEEVALLLRRQLHHPGDLLLELGDGFCCQRVPVVTPHRDLLTERTDKLPARLLAVADAGLKLVLDRP